MQNRKISRSIAVPLFLATTLCAGCNKTSISTSSKASITENNYSIL